jgi:hypothetical protein
MTDSARKDSWELGQQVADEQTRIFLKLVFDIMEVLGKYDECSVTANHRRQIGKRETEQRGPHSERIL